VVFFFFTVGVDEELEVMFDSGGPQMCDLIRSLVTCFVFAYLSVLVDVLRDVKVSGRS
jgi:hypothetical protein